KARVVEDFERTYIAGVLEAHGGKVGLAAKHAGLDPKNLSAKATRYRLRKAAGPAASEERGEPGRVGARSAPPRPRRSGDPEDASETAGLGGGDAASPRAGITRRTAVPRPAVESISMWPP